METVDYNGLVVYYEKHLQGGGQGYGREEYLKLLGSNTAPAPRRVFEWCAGPAFIGFSLLANNLCDSLCLADVNPEAVEVCRKTVEEGGLGDKVTVYCSDNLEQIPHSEQWDLVIGNPPHFDGDVEGHLALRSFDAGWKTHERFYAQVGKHLTEDGLILIIENNGSESKHTGSSPEIFEPFIEGGSLELVYTATLEAHPRMFWMGSMHSRQAWEASAWKPFLT